MVMFTTDLLSVSPSAIADQIRADGFFFAESAVPESFVRTCLAEVQNYRFSVNRNWVGGVYADRQYYLTHVLACSKAFTTLITSPLVLSICDELLGFPYRLKALRYYETYGRHIMQWHTDNKTDRGFAHIPGIIFLVYLGQVDDGEFQYVRGSQKWSGQTAYSDYTDAYINTHHRADVVSFKGPRGALLIYDTYGIHRAKPVMTKNFLRRSLFFQVDSKIDSAEPILLNPAFVESLDEKRKTYLGFGLPADYQIYPQTSMNSLPIGRMNMGAVVNWVGYRALRCVYDWMPHNVRMFLRETHWLR